jgi:hypothetical protein
VSAQALPQPAVSAFVEEVEILRLEHARWQYHALLECE